MQVANGDRVDTFRFEAGDCLVEGTSVEGRAYTVVGVDPLANAEPQIARYEWFWRC